MHWADLAHNTRQSEYDQDSAVQGTPCMCFHVLLVIVCRYRRHRSLFVILLLLGATNSYLRILLDHSLPLTIQTMSIKIAQTMCESIFSLARSHGHPDIPTGRSLCC